MLSITIYIMFCDDAKSYCCFSLTKATSSVHRPTNHDINQTICNLPKPKDSHAPTPLWITSSTWIRMIAFQIMGAPDHCYNLSWPDRDALFQGFAASHQCPKVPRWYINEIEGNLHNTNIIVSILMQRLYRPMNYVLQMCTEIILHSRAIMKCFISSKRFITLACWHLQKK